MDLIICYICDWLGLTIALTIFFQFQLTPPPTARCAPIDCLWREYSGGRFGFSVQYNIYKSVSFRRINNEYRVQGELNKLQKNRIRRINFGIAVGWCDIIEWCEEQQTFVDSTEDWIHIETFDAKDSYRDLGRVKTGWRDEDVLLPGPEPKEGFFPVLDIEKPIRRMRFLENLFERHYSYFASSS